MPLHLLPDDPLQEAELCWQQGQPRRALSLLYRGAVRELRLPEQTTEQENLALVQKNEDARTLQAFQVIMLAWQAQAWAGRTPPAFAPLAAAYRQRFLRRSASA